MKTKALHQMSEKEKAIFLFNLLPEQTGRFIDYSIRLAEDIANIKIVVGRNKNTKEGIHDWPGTARKMKSVFKEHAAEIKRNATLFANYLFDKSIACFTLYCLEQFMEEPANEGDNVYFALKLFFF